MQAQAAFWAQPLGSDTFEWTYVATRAVQLNVHVVL